MSLSDFAGWVIEIAETNRLSGTGRLARGFDFAIANGTVFQLRYDSGTFNALHTIGAFLHHAALPHSDFWI